MAAPSDTDDPRSTTAAPSLAGATARRARMPGAGRRRPAQRGQVDAGQPDPRPPRGRRRGRAGRDPGPGGLRRGVERAALHRRRHRRLGPRRPRPRRADLAPGRDRGRVWPTPCCSWSTPAVGITDTDETVVKILRRSRQAGRARRQQGRRPARRGRRRRAVEPGLGEPYPVSALHGRGSGDLLDAVLAALPEAPERGRSTRRAGRAGSRSSASPTSASRACSTSSPVRSGSSSTTSPVRRWTRSTRSSSSAGAPGSSSTPPASGAGSRRRAATSTTPRCGRPARWNAPRSPSS